MKKNVLITGCSGQLGHRLFHDLSNQFNIIDTYRRHLDANKKLDLLEKDDFEYIFSKYSPDIVINCAAITNVDYCENNKKHCHSVNVDGLSRILSFSKSNAKVIHISTDYVFDGSNEGCYSEDCATHPLNYYGKSKLESENILIGSNRNHLIFRVSMLFDDIHNNFFTWVLNSLKKGKQIKVATDLESNPTWIPFFSKAIMKSIFLDSSGLFHYGSDKPISRFEFACRIASRFNCDKQLIVPVKSKDIKFMAKRPRNTSLDSSKLSNLIDMKIDNIDYALKVIGNS